MSDLIAFRVRFESILSGTLVRISPFLRDMSLAFLLADLEVHIPDLTLDVVAFIQVLLVVVCRQVILFLLVMTVIVAAFLVITLGRVALGLIMTRRIISPLTIIVFAATAFLQFTTLAVIGFSAAAFFRLPALPVLGVPAAAFIFLAASPVIVLSTTAVFFVTSTLIIIPAHKSAYTSKITDIFEA